MYGYAIINLRFLRLNFCVVNMVQGGKSHVQLMQCQLSILQLTSSIAPGLLPNYSQPPNHTSIHTAHISEYGYLLRRWDHAQPSF